MASTSSSDGGLAAHDSMIRVVKFFATITQGSASPPAPLLVVKNGLMLESDLVVLGSAVAHRAVDAVLGSRSYHPAPVEATQAAQTVVQENMDCVESAKPFVDCMSMSNGDMDACSVFFERLQACRLALPQT
jgi:hypothetical protein